MIYVLEAIGSIAGGLLVSFFLIRLLNSFQIMAVLSLLNISAALFLQRAAEKRKVKSFLVFIFTISLAFLVFLWLFNGWGSFQQRSLKMQWKGYELLASRNSIYGNIVVTKRASQRSFFYNGLHLYTVPDPMIAEEAVHFALLEHPNPETVLLVGDGVGGLAKEILKHSVTKIDYVELDPMIISMAKEYLPEQEYSSLEDRRVAIKNMDGRLFVKGTSNKYDCVIVHLGDPCTAQLNRYYTVEFFKEVKRILKPGGILSFALSSSESYVSRELKELLRSVYASLKEEFSDVKVVPGEVAYFLACDKEGVLTYDYKMLAGRIRQRNIGVKYMREYYLFSRLSSEKISFTEDSLRPNSTVEINRDFKPAAYYYDMVFWAAHFRDSLFKRMLQFATPRKLWGILFAICVLIFSFAMIGSKKRKIFERKISVIAVTVTGFTQMCLQVVILLSFQAIYGYMFYKLSLIITCFMIGLALGGFWILNIMPKIKRDIIFFIRTQIAICIFSLALPLILYWLSRSRIEAVSWAGANLLFPLIPIIVGFIGGIQFLLVNKIYLNSDEAIGKVAGLTYGMDLFGSCLGAFFAAIFLIPILGIPETCYAVATVNVTVLVLLVISLRHKTDLRRQ
jgi:spermidine synthase